MKLAQRLFPSLLVCIVVIVADQLTKWWVRQTLWNPYRSVTVIPGLLQITPVENSGVAFGLFQSYGQYLPLLVLVLLLIAAVWYRKEFLAAPLAIRLLAGFILGGAAGNLIDRALYGYVTDFITIPLLPIFQVFNLADASITISGVIAAILVWRAGQHEDHATTEKRNLSL